MNQNITLYKILEMTLTYNTAGATPSGGLGADPQRANGS